MTTETTITEPPSRAQTLIEIVNSGLPIPREISFHENGSMDLTFDRYADLQTWSQHVGATVRCDRWAASNGGILTCHDGQWSGWRLVLYVHETAESIAALESVAEPEHVAVSDSRCSCGWEVDGFTAPELTRCNASASAS